MKQQALEGTVAEQERRDNEQRAPDGGAFDQTFGPAADLLAANALVRSLRDDIESLRSECAWLRAARSAPADGCAEGRYRILFDSIDEAFCTLGDFVFDAQGRCLDYRYLEVNPAMSARPACAACRAVPRASWPPAKTAACTMPSAGSR